MGTFAKVAEVQNGGVQETLHWDGRDGFMLVGTFIAMGQSVETEKTHEEAIRDLMTWGQLSQLDDQFQVLFADEGALDKIMEGQEWHPIRAASQEK